MSRQGKGNKPKGMILLARGNRILEETVRDQIIRAPDQKKVTMLDVKLCDFDDVSYCVKIDGTNDPDSPMVVAIGCPAYHNIKDMADAELTNVFGELVAAEAPSMYDHALEIKLDELPEDEKDKEALVQKIAVYKYTLLSGPFRHYFNDLAEGKNSGEDFKFDLRSDTTIYITPRDDRVTCIFAIDFQNKVDKVLARVFMQELCDARKRVRTAPPFDWSQNPPKELQPMGVTENPGVLGYASIAIMQTQVKKGLKQDEVIGALLNFRTFVQYHLKCAKSYFHSRMRKRCSDLLKILNRAKTKFGASVKKTKTGKTFKRQG